MGNNRTGRKLAGLHTFLDRIGVMKNFDVDEFDTLCAHSRKRLKRAKWARYGKKPK